jgi:tetratricopeptide (TPR) repeat protein
MDQQDFDRLTRFFYQSPDVDKVPAALEHFLDSESPRDLRRTALNRSHTADILWYFFTRVAHLYPLVLRGYEAVFRRSVTGREFILTVLAAAGDPETRSFLCSCTRDREYTAVHHLISEVLKKWSPAGIDALEWSIEWAGDLDFLWVEFIVTGNKRPIQPIISVLDWPDRIRERLQSWLRKNPLLSLFSRRKQRAAKLRDIAGIVCDLSRREILTEDDLDCMLTTQGPEHWQAVRKVLPFRLSEADLIHISTKSAAKWSLGSFIREHLKAREVCIEELERRRVQEGKERTTRLLYEIVSLADEPGRRPFANAKAQDETVSQEPGSHSVPPSTLGWGPGQILLGEFVVEAELGQGGMGKVYLVRSQSTSQRFAVKTARFRDDASRRNFLAELQMWIGLPEHPNLAACRFFRTIGAELVIFAEYHEGGSLADWIRMRRLTEIDQVMDIAIQSAWGLHAAHELGLIHQDVKPANFLMSGDGVVKVGDFGLARARALAGEAGTPGPHSVLISAGGMTPAYCSPEQAEGKPLGRTTDVWSWGLSILQMFVGRVTWQSGVAAPQVLQEYLKIGRPAAWLPVITPPLAGVLKKCFRRDPAKRWANMAEIAQVMIDLYRDEVGEAYGRKAPAAYSRHQQPPILHDRRTYRAPFQWPNPRQGLHRAFEADGRDPAEAEALLAKQLGSRRAQAIADLAAYQEAYRIFDRLVVSGRKDLEITLAAHCIFQAAIHLALDDIPGALHLYDRAIALHQAPLSQEGSPDAAYGLAGAYSDKGNALRSLGDNSAAVAQYDRALDLYSRLSPLALDEEVRHGITAALAQVYGKKAEAVRAMGDNRTAVAIFDQAIAAAEQVVSEESQADLGSEFAAFYVGKAIALRGLGDDRAALALYDRALGIAERLATQQGSRGSPHILAAIYSEKAEALRALNDNRTAAALCDKAIALYEPLVNQESRHEFAADLAATYMSKADALRDSGDSRGAIAVYKQAIATRERLVNQEGRGELAGALAVTYQHKANALITLGDNRAAVALYDRAIALVEPLVNQVGRRELADHLSGFYNDKGRALWALGKIRDAVDLYDKAIAIREQLVNQEGSHGLAESLAMVYMNKAVAIRGLGDNRGAVALYDKCLAIRERLVNQEGRRELENWLASTYLNKGVALCMLGKNRRGMALFERAIAILDRLVEQEGRNELAGDLAGAYMNMASALSGRGDQRGAATRVDQAITLLERLVNEDGRSELADRLTIAYRMRAEARRTRR